MDELKVVRTIRFQMIHAAQKVTFNRLTEVSAFVSCVCVCFSNETTDKLPTTCKTKHLLSARDYTQFSH